MALTKKQKLTLEKQREWVKEQLRLGIPYAAYNVCVSDDQDRDYETQGDYRDDPDDFFEWLLDDIDEMDWYDEDSVLSITSIEADHRLADEVKEDKEGLQELAPVSIYLPGANQILQISEGTGDNLSDEDLDNGFIDYIYYAQRDLDDLSEECDGGQIDKKERVRDLYTSFTEAIPEVLELAFGTPDLSYVLLEAADETENGRTVIRNNAVTFLNAEEMAIADAADEALVNELKNRGFSVTKENEMTMTRAVELLNSVVDHVTVANNTAESISELMSMGFGTEDLVYFGFTKEDIESWSSEQGD